MSSRIDNQISLTIFGTAHERLHHQRISKEAVILSIAGEDLEHKTETGLGSAAQVSDTGMTVVMRGEL